MSYTTISRLSAHLPSMVLGCEMNSAGFTTNLFPSTNNVTLSPHTGGPRWLWWLDPASESLTFTLELLAPPRPLPGRSWIVCLSPLSWVCVWAWRCVTGVMVDECSAPAGGRVSGGEWSPVVEAPVWETVGCCWGWGWWWTCWSELLAGEEWALPLGLSLVVLRLWLVRGILSQSHKMLTMKLCLGSKVTFTTLLLDSGATTPNWLEQGSSLISLKVTGKLSDLDLKELNCLQFFQQIFHSVAIHLVICCRLSCRAEFCLQIY